MEVIFLGIIILKNDIMSEMVKYIIYYIVINYDFYLKKINIFFF